MRRLQYYISFKNVAPSWDCGTSNFNRKYQYGQNRDRLPNTRDENNLTNDFLTTEGEVWQDESNKLIPNEPQSVSRTKGLTFNMTKFISTG